jgi:hypothetical protein
LDFLKNDVAPAGHEIIGKTQNLPAPRAQSRVAVHVVKTLFGLIVRRTVQLDDDPRGNADKIGDVRAYGYLPPELRADTAIAQAAPQNRFRDRHIAAQAARLGKLRIGKAADHGGNIEDS